MTHSFDGCCAFHKALRAATHAAVLQLGRVDWGDAAACTAALDATQAALDLLQGHLARELRLVHPALDACRPGAARWLADDHARQARAVQHLQTDVATLRQRLAGDEAAEHGAVLDDPSCGALHDALYDGLCRFTAEHLEPMLTAQRQYHAELREHRAEAELLALRRRLIQDISPAEWRTWPRWGAEALSVSEIAQVLVDLDNQPAAVDAAIDGLAQWMSQPRHAALCRLLDRPPVAGLVTV